MEKKCPCCSGKTYADCCKPYHDGALPPTALDLMRSRYSAYALQKADYIIQTTHPNSPYFEKNREKWKKGILEFSRTTEFLKLEILESEETQVKFAAYLRQKEGSFILEEKSQFQKIDGKWLYLTGQVSTRPA